MAIRLGDKAPDFKQVSTQGPIHFYEWAGKSWVVFFSHPADFTPVCTTELGMTSKLMGEFEKRNVKVLGLSVDPLSRHQEWISDINETQGTDVRFPILADKERKVAELYDMMDPTILVNATVRSVFIIDPEKKVRAMITYPASTGRNFDEILRVVDSLQLTDKYMVATPVNWRPGDEVVILPSLQDNVRMEKLFPKGYRTLRPYLRMTPDPSRK
jgi:thioredoxin-dependent peroxiredoxin